MESSPVLPAAPGPSGLALVRIMRRLLGREQIRALTEAAGYGDVVRFPLGKDTFFLVNSPEGVRHVLQENAKNYRKGKKYEELRPMLGNGLLTSEGDFWLRQRRMAQPAFHRQRLAGLATTMVRVTERLVAEWQPKAASQERLDVPYEMVKVTVDIVGRTLLGLELGSRAHEIGADLTYALHYIHNRSKAVLPLPRQWPTWSNWRFQRATEKLDGIVRQIIETRQRGHRDGETLLDMLLDARDDDDQPMSPQQLRDEVMTLLLAGHETTATALSWAFYLLSQHPHVERQLHDELDTVLGDRPLELADLPKLTYTRRVIHEVMRLYPPAWLVHRHSLQEDVVDGSPIAADSLIFVSPYLLHRHRAYWDQPERFDPDRFLPEAVQQRPKFAYLPFGGGPRTCIGNEFAMMEATIILALLARRFRLSLPMGTKIEAESMVTLRPKTTLRMRLEERHASPAPWRATA